MADAAILGLMAGISSKMASLSSLGDPLESKVEKFTNPILSIRAVLMDMEDRPPQKRRSEVVQNWIRKVGELLLDVDDLLDDLATEALRRKAEERNIVEKVIGFFPNLGFHFSMFHRLRNLRQRLDYVASEWTSFYYMDPSVAQSRPFAEPDVLESRMTHSFVVEGGVVGRDHDKKAIMELLLSSGDREEVDVSVISIVGMGGIGKTTLAQLVYNDELVRRHFDLQLWLSCGSNYDFEVGAFARKIMEATTYEEVSHLGFDQLLVRVQEVLGGKRYLLVLDDVWNVNYERWVELRDLLMCPARGSKILVTTRSVRVAGMMGTGSVHYLDALSVHDSWSMFRKLAFGPQQVEESPNLVSIGKKIVTRCGGLPLALRTVAGLLYMRKTEREWLSVSDSDLFTLDSGRPEILSVLKISYDDLPYYLKQCFAYCSIFPAGFRIEKETLVKLWMAQGYIYSPDGKSLKEDIGDEYFQNLCWRSFFQYVEKDKFGNVISCKMHDLIRDLAQAVAQEQILIWDGETPNISERLLHLSLTRDFCLSPTPIPLLKARKLRTVFVASGDGLLNMSSINVICSNSSSLRVLDVHDTGIETLPSSIGQMKHLRYLDISKNTWMTTLPRSIIRLQNLQTLKLSKCSGLNELPEDIGKWVSLRHLEIDDCDGLTRMPHGLGQLTSLQTLSLFVLDNNGCGLSELQSLNSLRGKLQIKNLNIIRNSASKAKEANLKGKQDLVVLELIWNCPADGDVENDLEVLEGLQPHQNLKELRVKGYQSEHFPAWMMDPSQLQNIIEISIEDCFRCQHLPSFGQIPLQVLKIKGCKTLRSLSGIRQLTALSTLQIEDCQMLDLSDESGLPSFESLHSLKISGLPKLVVLPEWLQKSTLLQDLSINDCDNLEILPKWLRQMSSLNLQIFSCHKLSDFAT